MISTGKSWFAALLWIVLETPAAPPLRAQSTSLPVSAGEWSRSDSARIFAGKDLFRLIDGGADLFFEYGFVRVVTSEYDHPLNARATAELYEMESPESAYGLFSSFTAGTGVPVPVGQEAVLGEGYCIFWKGPFVGMLTESSVDSLSGRLLLQLAGELEGRIRTSGNLPDLCAVLRNGTIDYRTMVFVRGRLAIGNCIPQKWASILPPATGVAGRVDECSYLILEYSDGAAAGVALQAAEEAWTKLQVPAALDPGGRWTIRFQGEDPANLGVEGRYLVAVSGKGEKPKALFSRLTRILGG